MIHERGDVFQINEKHERAGWMGCLVVADSVAGWGIRGRIAWPEDHKKQAVTYIRLPWSEIDFVGKAPLVPKD